MLVRSRASYSWLLQCLNSILKQKYEKFTILLIDDVSDYTREQKQEIQQLLKTHVAIFNRERKYSLRNAYEAINEYATDDLGIVVNIDGDDYLTSENALARINHIYEVKKCLLSYGECRIVFPSFSWKSWLPSKYVFSQHNTRYPKQVEVMGEYRRDPIFRPLHPRTWRVDLFEKIKEKDFKDNQGNWLMTCEDQAMFFPMLEMSGGHYFVDSKIMYAYRWDHPNTDYRIRQQQQRLDEILIRNKSKYEQIYE